MIRNKVFQTGLFSGKAKQPLKNVLIFAPTIIWVTQGNKRLWWQEDNINYKNNSWLLSPANHYLTFINEPEQHRFFSRTLTFFISPPNEWIIASANKEKLKKPKIEVNSALSYCFNSLYEINKHNLSIKAQEYLVLALYAELKEINALSLLFPDQHNKLRERLSRYLSIEPSKEHKIETVAAHFLMSPATLKRKLSAEGTSFSQLLVEVRMNFSLELFQKGYDVQNAALACGYQSTTRFSQRFKQVFDLSPKDYISTILK